MRTTRLIHSVPNGGREDVLVTFEGDQMTVENDAAVVSASPDGEGR